MYKIMIIEDDSVISGVIQKSIESWGWEAFCVSDFSDIMGPFVQMDPQLVLLDISLPFYNGYYWCTEIRKVSKVPIIIISSTADNMNIVMAMNMGADDFIAKPFDLSVLTAKVQAMLRRTYDFAASGTLIEHKGAILNLADGSLNYNGQRIDLTKNEFRIIQVLMENRCKTVTRDSIMTALWESDSFVDENTLTVNVTRLRKKLEAAGLVEYIKTRKGEGYIIE